MSNVNLSDAEVQALADLDAELEAMMSEWRIKSEAKFADDEAEFMIEEMIARDESIADLEVLADLNPDILGY